MKGECYCEWDYFLLVLDILVQFVQPFVRAYLPATARCDHRRQF